MNIDDGTIRNLSAPQADPLLGAREIEIVREEALRLLTKAKLATCRSCGNQMAGNGRALTGTCSRCLALGSVSASPAGGPKLSRRQRRLQARKSR